LAFECTGLLGGLPAFFFGLGWLLRIVGRRRQVQMGQWVAYPARAAIMRQGPLWSTVVGLEITQTAMQGEQLGLAAFARARGSAL
jgi:hypothetical protein